MNTLSLNRNSIFVSTLILVYVAFFLWFFNHPYKEIGWGDYYAWLNIAEKYADGHFKEALNAYWSPLTIWCMIPLLKLFPYKEIWIINFFAGLVLIRLSFVIARQCSLTGFVKYLFILGMYIFALSFQLLYNDAADFLSAVCLIGYITVISDDKLRDKRNYFWTCILVAALCMFGKLFYIYFILAHLVLLLAYRIAIRKRSQKPDHSIANILRVFAGVLLLVSVWGSLLNWKYGHFMLSSSGRFNFTIMTPGGLTGEFETSHGLVSPPDQYSYFPWVDPTYYMPPERRAFKDRTSFQYQLGIYIYNFKIFQYLFSYFSYFKMAILLLIIPALLLKNNALKEKVVLYFISALMIMGGYFLIFLEERYMIGVHILFFMFTYLTVTGFLKEKNITMKHPLLLSVASIVVVIAFCKIANLTADDWKRRDWNHMEKLFRFEKALTQLTFLKNGRIAYTNIQGEVGAAVYYELFRKLGCHHYGGFRKMSTPEEQYAELKKYEIDYYFYLGCFKESKVKACDDSNLPFYLKDKKLLYTNPEFGIRIYGMKPY
ncbi:MAG TPA: hypothetical protein VNB90_07935 [Cytophagaceae bacterium]|nr:hypothetical protein [Cytophagaceae bacterium]